jgi:F-type H+-transporting ATPase subunit gamma
MSDTLQSLRRKIDGAGQVASVVSAMKAVAASSIAQYDNAVAALTDYHRTIDLGLSVCFRHDALIEDRKPEAGANEETGVIVFGSDQGLVGQFNNDLADFVKSTLEELPGTKKIWVCGIRIQETLSTAGIAVSGSFDLPASIDSITQLVLDALNMLEPQLTKWQEGGGLYLINNRPKTEATYEPISRRILPLDKTWLMERAQTPWPTNKLPEILGAVEEALLREYLVISIFQASAESLASENASRLAAMQRAEKNVSDLLAVLNQTYRRLRQSSIDEEMFDVVSGYVAPQ